LKRRVRDVIEPGRDLGHVDRSHKPAVAEASSAMEKDETPAPRRKIMPVPADAKAHNPVRMNAGNVMAVANLPPPGRSIQQRIEERDRWLAEEAAASQQVSGEANDKPESGDSSSKAENKEKCEDCV
jgi:hypothetical protein